MKVLRFAKTGELFDVIAIDNTVLGYEGFHWLCLRAPMDQIILLVGNTLLTARGGVSPTNSVYRDKKYTPLQIELLNNQDQICWVKVPLSQDLSRVLPGRLFHRVDLSLHVSIHDEMNNAGMVSALMEVE